MGLASDLEKRGFKFIAYRTNISSNDRETDNSVIRGPDGAIVVRTSKGSFYHGPLELSEDNKYIEDMECPAGFLSLPVISRLSETRSRFSQVDGPNRRAIKRHYPNQQVV